jgi:hypothetical protein
MNTIRDMVERLRAEYLEMPGLHLTAEQVQRLCGIERTACRTVLDALIKAKFLAEKPDGHFARLTEGYFSNPRPAIADLGTDAVDERRGPGSRQPERRRARSDAELREQRNTLERQWNEDHRASEAHQERGSAEAAAGLPSMSIRSRRRRVDEAT